MAEDKNQGKKAIDEQNVYIRDTLMSIAAKYGEVLKEAVEDAFDSAEASVLNAVGKDLTRSFTKLAKMSDDFAFNQSRIKKGVLDQKDIEKQIQSVKEKQESLARKIEHARRLGLEVSKEDKEAAEESLKVQLEMLEADKQLAKSISGRIGLQKAGEEIKKKFRVDELKETFSIYGLLMLIVKAALRFNETSVNISKNLGYGADNADRVTQNLTQVANNSNNINVTLKSAAEAMNELNAATGGVAEYSADTLETQVLLTKQLGLSGEEAAGIYKFSVLTGKSSSQVNREMAGAFANTRNSVKGSANFKTTMAEVAKVSGQLAANLRNNPASITKAVVQAQALGTTLEKAKSQGEALLNFESSIESELKAELLTGQQMNLERARAAALQGDQVTVMKELANQGMTLEKFQGMNVIAQKSFAEALGLSADELSDQLNKQKIAQEQGKSLAQITEEEALEAEKRQNIQDKFNAAIEKLQDFFGNLVAGPLGTMLDMLSQALDIVNLILMPFQALYSFTSMIGQALFGWIDKLGVVGKIIKGIAGIAIIFAAYSAFAALAGIPVVGPVLGGIAAAAITAAGFGLLNTKSKAGDMISPADGKTQVSTKEGGLFELSKNDDLLAGPGLAKATKGGGKGESISPTIDLTPMIAAINQVKASVDRLYTKDSTINMDGKKVGTTLSQGSHKVA